MLCVNRMTIVIAIKLDMANSHMQSADKTIHLSDFAICSSYYFTNIKKNST